MAHFGGYSQFGGSSNFGGQDNRGEVYHRVFRSLEPPGVFDESPGTLRDDRLRTYASGMGDHAQVVLDRLEGEMFPRTSEEMLSMWEELFRVPSKPGSTLAQRQAVVFARWQGAQPSTKESIRMMLADILNPVVAFWDRLDDDDVSFRFTQRAGDGSITEDELAIYLLVNNPDTGGWSGSEDDCPRITTPLVDRSDDVTVQAQVLDQTATDNQAGGVCLILDGNNAVCVEVYRDGGTRYVRMWAIESGVVTLQTGVAAPAFPFWIQVKKFEGNFIGAYGSDDEDMTDLQTINSRFTPRDFGLFGRNMTPGYVMSSTEFDDLKAWYEKKWNNVEIISTPQSIVPSDAPENVFMAFVHREPTDAGSYNLPEAQRILDRVKHAHELILVGESDCFRCDDEFSLTDRDVLGS